MRKNEGEQIEETFTRQFGVESNSREGAGSIL